MLALILGLGTIGYMRIEGWPPWDAFFFTIITITTVGYGDGGLTDAGEGFTVFVMLSGIGTLTYAIGQSMNAIIRHQFDRERHMQQQISKLDNHFVLCGLGRIGEIVASDLESRGIPFVAIEIDPECVELACERGWLVVEGSATDEKLLERARIEHARGIAVLTNNDTENIVITMTARQMVPGLEIISRSEHANSVPKMRLAGASRVISPSRLSGRIVADSLLSPAAAALLGADVDTPSAIQLTDIYLSSGCKIVGQPFADWEREHPDVSLVATIGKGGEVAMRPSPATHFEAESTIVLAGAFQSLETARFEICGSRRME